MASYFNPNRVIDKIKFGLLSPEEIRKMSATRIITADTYDEDGLPIPSGLMDQKLGTIEPGQKCATCGNRVGQCPGHFGHIELSRPVVHVSFAQLILKILRATCPECGRLMLTEDQIKEFEEKKKLMWDVFGAINDVLIQNIFKKARKTKECPYCSAKKKRITIEKPTTFYEEVEWQGSRRLNAIEIRERLAKMTDSDCRLLEINPEATRPEWMILTVLPIPPVCVRPSITLDSGIRSEDDLTHKLVDVIRINQRLKENIEAGAPQLIVEDLWELLQYHITTFFNNDTKGIPSARHRSGRAFVTLVQRLKGKNGRFRKNLSGKRVDFSARTVISPNPHLSINEVGVPENITKILTIPTRVTEWNTKEMKQLIINGPHKHPGANYIIRKDKRRIDLRYVRDKKLIADSIEPGVIVERHLKNGDLVLFNRQPSLHRMSIMAHKVRVMPGKTFRLSLLVCPPYNADFDGDEMNLHVPQGEEARAEAEFLLKVEKHIISPRHGHPIIGGISDYISILYLFTRKDSLFDKKTTYQLLEWGNVLYHNPTFKLSDLKPVVTDPKPLYSGKSIFSILLPHDLNLRQKTKLCRNCTDDNGNPICYEDDCPYDAFVNITNGELISGAIDESLYGVRKSGNILSIIFRDYGPKKTREFLNDSSNMLLYLLMQHPLTLTLDEFDVSDGIDRINKIIDNAEKEINEIIDVCNRDNNSILEITGLPVISLLGALESIIIQILKKACADATLIAMDILGNSSNPMIIVRSGAKGSLINISQISVCLGQHLIRSKRINRGFDRRTLAHFKKNDLSPRAHGFVRSSFYKGLEPIEFFMNAIGGREGLVDTAVRTSFSGYMQRRLINALQDMVVQNDGSVRTSTGNIIQFVYGDDMVDPAKSMHGLPMDLENIFRKVKNLENIKRKEKQLIKRKKAILEKEHSSLAKKELKAIRQLEKSGIQIDLD
ncbi:MAG: DNA-directed RNA polymerase subunit A' [Promethearchaeota archaeon]